MNTVNIAGLPKPALLVALYNASKQQGLGLLNPDGRKLLTRENAHLVLLQGTYIDYLNGRVLKVDLSGDELGTGAYNRDNGDGAAEAVVAALRASTPSATASARA